MQYEDRLLFEQLDLDVAAGEVLTVIGRSGCGKSTLLQILGGLLRPDAGEVCVNGQPTTGAPGKASLMFQHSLLLPWRSLLDNAILALEIAGHSRQMARTQAFAQLPAFGLAGRESLMPHQMSGGMAQRTALLRSFLHGSPVLLLDEPFGALDAITRHELHQWFAHLVPGKGLAAVLVTHDIDEAQALASRVLVFAKDGRVVLKDRPGDKQDRADWRQALLELL